jgi:1-acyl-sn-glycerol-3-phosphate acyltransferase
MAASRPLRSAARAAAAAERMVGRIARPTRNVGFPYRPPTTPRGVEVPADPPSLGADYDTRWARTPLARAARGVLSSGPLQLAVHVVAHPEIRGHDRLVDLVRRAEDRGEAPPPVIFTPNHHSHVDTGLMVRAVPAAWRPHLVTAAAADYFFDRRWKARLAGLIERGWSLVIYPEGGRSPDGWGQPFKGGAAYLANRTGAPVVPVHIDGTDSIFAKGMKWPQPGRSIVTFGRPLWPATGESTRRLNERIERAVAELADEAATDYWSARRRAGAGATPTLLGPEHTGWRRAWDLTAKRERGIAGWNRRPSRRWPDLG